MSKEYKILIGLGLLGLVAYMVVSRKKVTPSMIKLMDDDNTITAVSNVNVCGKGLIPCPDNTSKCYDPKVDYAVNPCRETETNFE